MWIKHPRNIFIARENLTSSLSLIALISDPVNKPEVKVLDENHCIAIWHNVLIQVWRGSTTLKAVAKLSMISRDFMQRHPDPICSISVVERTSPPPDPEVRGKLAAFYKEHAPKMHVAVVVAEGGGFRNAIVRGVGLTLSAIAPRSLPFQFTGSVADGVKSIAPHLSRSARGAAGLESAISDVRNRMPVFVTET